MVISKIKLDLAMSRQKRNKAQLASAMGISKTRMYTILGQKNVTPAVAGRIAEALNVDVTEIIEED